MLIDDDINRESDISDYEESLRRNGLQNQSFVSFGSQSSFDADIQRDNRTISDPSTNNDFIESAKMSKFFVNQHTKEVTDADFVLAASIKESDYLPPNLYKPAYLYKKYKYADLFRLEMLNVFLYTFMVTNIQFICIFLNSSFESCYFMRIFAHISSLIFIMTIFGNSETLRSINITLEFTMINTILFNYTLIDTLLYIVIQLIISIIANLLVFSIYYKVISDLSINDLMNRLVHFHSDTDEYMKYFNNYTSAILIIFELFILISITTHLINTITSIDYKKIVVYKLSLFGFLNMSFAAGSCIVTSVSYNLSTSIALSIFKSDLSSISYMSYINVYMFFLTAAVSLLTTWFSFFHLKNYYYRYIEV